MQLDYRLAIGLHIYLRQLELSLDRALPSDIRGIREYFMSGMQYSPEYVANYFEAFLKKNEDLIFVNSNASSSLLNLSHSNLRVKYKDMLSLINNLHSVHELINADTLDVDEFVRMRMVLNKMNYNQFEKNLGREHKKTAVSVEHFNQSDYLNLAQIDSLLGVKWLG